MWNQETWQAVFHALLQPLPLIVIMTSQGILFFIAFVAGLAHGRRKYSRKNMPEQSRQRIDELALRLHDSEAERIRSVAENRVLWARHRAMVGLATKPLEFEQERQLLATEKPLQLVGRRK
jgi:hypothetical protein